MAVHKFGGREFSVVIDDHDLPVPFGSHAPMHIGFAGEGWAIGGTDDETFGAVVPRLLTFGQAPRVRHWAAFIGLDSYEEVLQRVIRYGYARPTPVRSSLHPWDTSSAFTAYCLSALFDGNLGVGAAVMIRGGRTGTLIVQENSGDIRIVEVPVKQFDRAVADLDVWSTAVGRSETS